MKKLFLLLISFSTIAFYSCDERLEELNTDKKNPSEVDPSSLFARGLKVTFDNVESASVNDNPFRLYAQHWSQTTYPEESQYNLTSRSIPANFWENIYRDVLADLDESKRLINAEIEAGNFANTPEAVFRNQISCIEILSAYNYTLLVDTYGDIPYTDALDVENISPSYDDAETVYKDLVDRIDAAVAAFDNSANGFSAAQDAMYNGNVSSWTLFANTLKLRIGMRFADYDAAYAEDLVTEAVADGVFTSAADNASVQYMSAAPNTNPVYAAIVLSGRNDFVISDVLDETLNSLQDPRLKQYSSEMVNFPFPVDGDDNEMDSTLAYGVFATYTNEDGEDSVETYLAANTTVSAEYAGKLKVYKGGTYGTANSFVSNSKLSSQLYNDPTFAGTLISYSEVQFLLAEAVERNMIGGDAQTYYNAGIEASFDFWGADGFEDYILQPEVNYITATGTYKEKIGRQLWIALFNQGFEAWASYRRLDFGILEPLPGDESVSVPMRLIYPLEEDQLNGQNKSDAASAIGGDEVTTKVFWDVN